MTSKRTKYNPTISREELNALPIKTFSGEICVVTTPQEIDGTIREIRLHNVVGFDTETRPSFRKGESHDVALIQLAIPGKVYLIRLCKTKLSTSIIALLEDDKMVKAGVGLENDIQALQKLCPFKANGFIELSTMAKTIGLQVGSVRKLAGIILGFRISKSAQVSNWEAEAYTNKQIYYAATDAWACLALYKKLAAELKHPVDPTGITLK